MTALHMGGIPELSMALGPILLIAVFIKIARRNEAQDDDEDEDESQPRPSSADNASASSCQSVSIENTGPRAW
jgi:hypothetical protein